MNRYLSIIATASFLCLAACGNDVDVPVGNDEIVVVPSLEETRATLIPAGDLTDSEIHIDGYIHNTENKFLNSAILYDESAWVFYTDLYKGVHYYWPQNSNLDLLAYSPADLENTCVSILDSKTIKCTALPLADSLQADKKLKEFVCGYKANCKQSDGAISMTLNRPFAIVYFHLDQALRSTLNYIEIKGLYTTAVYDASATSSPWSSWETKGDLYCSVGKKYPEEINNGKIGGPFLVIPQSLRASETDPVKLVFSYKSAGNVNNTITETTIGNAKNGSNAQVLAWEPGKVYNYWISLNGAANEVRMKVTFDLWTIEGNEDIEVK